MGQKRRYFYKSGTQTGISTSWFSELYIDAQNNVYVGGNFYKYLNLGTGFVYDLNNERYLILAKYNTLGVVQSCEVYPYNPNSAANIKVLNSGNNFSIISTVYSNLQLNNLSFQVNQSARKYIAKRKDPAASNEEFNLNNYTVYPNPVRDLLFVDGIENLSEEAQFTIFDSNGKKISEVEKGGLLSKGINISHIASGIYFLSIYDPIGNVKQYSKFIKNK